MAALVPPVVPLGRLSARRQPRLEAGELTLRPWRPSEVPRLVEAYQDEAVQRWHVRTMTDEDALRGVAARQCGWLAETSADWAVVEQDSLLGRVGLRRLDLAEGLGEATYWVLLVARGRGVAPSALRAITCWFFTEVGLHRIELEHSIRNQPSCRVAAKAGYAYEGTKRRGVLHADGWHSPPAGRSSTGASVRTGTVHGERRTVVLGEAAGRRRSPRWS